MLYSLADEIWDSSSDDVLIPDCRVAQHAGSYVVRVTYDQYGEPRTRTLATVEAAERFLFGPLDYSLHSRQYGRRELGCGYGTLTARFGSVSETFCSTVAVHVHVVGKLVKACMRFLAD